MLDAEVPPNNRPPEIPLNVVVPARWPPALTLKVVDEVVPAVIVCVNLILKFDVATPIYPGIVAKAFDVES